MDHQQLLRIALRVLANETVRRVESDEADKRALLQAARDGDELLSMLELARRTVNRERGALGWGMSAMDAQSMGTRPEFGQRRAS